jgi:hypothetical protein
LTPVTKLAATQHGARSTKPVGDARLKAALSTIPAVSHAAERASCQNEPDRSSPKHSALTLGGQV